MFTAERCLDRPLLKTSLATLMTDVAKLLTPTYTPSPTLTQMMKLATMRI